MLTQIENKEVYEFSGPAKNFNDLGEALKVAINQNVKIVKMPASDYTAQLEKTGLDHDTAVLFTSFQKPIDDGSLETSSTDLVDVLGHNLKRLPDAIQEILEK
ncbi:Nucleoside-diphosphate-sugar epimerase (fragment) [Leuconostoc carnosum]